MSSRSRFAITYRYHFIYRGHKWQKLMLQASARCSNFCPLSFWVDTDYTRKVTSIKSKFQANRTYNAITSLVLNSTFVGKRVNLQNTVNMNDYPSRFGNQTRRRVLVWRKSLCAQSTIRFMTQYRKKIRLHKKATHASAQSSQTPSFIVIFNAWTWNASSSLWIRNVM